MIPKIAKKYAHLQSSFNELLKYMDSFSEDQLTASTPNVWSPTQVLYHLWQSESGTRSYLEKKLLADPKSVEKTSIANSLKATLLKKALKNSKKKFEAPKILAEIPEKPNYQELKTSFIQTRQELEETLSKFDEDKSARAYFKHPAVGRLNIYQTLDFLTAHFDRHAAQIKERIQ